MTSSTEKLEIDGNILLKDPEEYKSGHNKWMHSAGFKHSKDLFIAKTDDPYVVLVEGLHDALLLYQENIPVIKIKSGSVSEHDAYHLLLVRRLREEFPSKSLGPSCWFLTYDVSLLEADKALNRLIKSPHAAPSSLLVDTWALIASLFLDNHLEKENLASIFIDLFRNHFATSLRGISASMIVEVLSPYLSYKSLSDDDLKAVLDDEHVKRLYFQLREARSTDPRKARLIYDEMHQRVDSIVWKLLENRVKETGFL